MNRERHQEIIRGILNGTDRYYSRSHFHASNMADYCLMSTTIRDMSAVYHISQEDAAEIVEALTHT